MLVEPEQDPHRLAADQAVVEAIRARAALGPHASVDAAAIGLRQLLPTLSSYDRQAVRALLGRIEAATAPPLVSCGPLSQMLASDRWGLSHSPVAEPDQALKHAASGGRALIDLSSPRPWWAKLLALPQVRVTGALPDDAASLPRCLLISTEGSGPTGDDRTFWVTDSGWPDARIAEALGQQGLYASPISASGGLKLFILTGYVQAQDPRLASAPGQISGVIGAAPVY